MENDEAAISGFVKLATVLAALQRNLERAKTDRAASINLKNSEVCMVHILHSAQGGLSAEELSRMCRLDRSLISRNTRSLMDKGLIARPVTRGKRSYGARLCLTEQGMHVGDIVERYIRSVQDFVDEGIPRRDIDIMYSTLDRLCERFELMNNMPKENLALAGLYIPE